MSERCYRTSNEINRTVCQISIDFIVILPQQKEKDLNLIDGKHAAEDRFSIVESFNIK